MEMNERSFISVLDAFVRLDFSDWHGLPECRLGDLEAVLTVDRSWLGKGKLGSEQRAADYVMANAGGCEEQVRIWLKGDRVLMIDADFSAEQPPVKTKLPILGEPETRLDNYLGVIFIERSEWVYAGRGLTLFINPEDGTLLRLAIYPPTTADEYVRGLRLDYCPRPLPFNDVAP